MAHYTQVSTELRSGFDRERESLQTQHAAALEKLRETLSAQQYVGLSRSEAQTAEAVAQAANLKIQLDAENKSYADRVRVLEQGLAVWFAAARKKIALFDPNAAKLTAARTYFFLCRRLNTRVLPTRLWRSNSSACT